MPDVPDGHPPGLSRLAQRRQHREVGGAGVIFAEEDALAVRRVGRVEQHQPLAQQQRPDRGAAVRTGVDHQHPGALPGVGQPLRIGTAVRLPVQPGAGHRRHPMGDGVVHAASSPTVPRSTGPSTRSESPITAASPRTTATAPAGAR